MPTRRLSRPRHRQDVRAWQAEHLAAYGRSGQTQGRQLPNAWSGPEVLPPLERKAAPSFGGLPSHGPRGGHAECGTSGSRDGRHGAGLSSAVPAPVLGQRPVPVARHRPRFPAGGGARPLEASMLKPPPDMRIFMAVVPADMPAASQVGARSSPRRWEPIPSRAICSYSGESAPTACRQRLSRPARERAWTAHPHATVPMSSPTLRSPGAPGKLPHSQAVAAAPPPAL